MGRYAQARRRASTGQEPGPPTPNAVTLLAVAADGTDWILTFSGGIVVTAGLQDGAFTVGDASFFQCQGGAGSAASGVDDGSAGYVSGLFWSLNSQPNWLQTPIAGPSSGTTI